MELKSKMSVYFRDQDLQQIKAACDANGIDIDSAPNLSALVMQMVSKIEYPLLNPDEADSILKAELESLKKLNADLMSEIETLRNSEFETIDIQQYADLKTRFDTLRADYNLIVSQAQTMVSTDDAEMQTLKSENAKLKSEIVQLSGMVHEETKIDNPKPGNWFNDIFK